MKSLKKYIKRRRYTVLQISTLQSFFDGIEN